MFYEELICAFGLGLVPVFSDPLLTSVLNEA